MKPAAIGLAAILTVVAGAASAQSAPVASSRTVPAQVQNSADAALDERLAACRTTPCKMPHRPRILRA